ncbi:glutaminase A [Cryobacterium melibiosiphilum]|uniref:Glutaminase n=1 Tax=Cryobacterium melibiosiphilum TaxID=995039 RepID=A0A3A5MIE9_9MICO|nr:glutaminase A [Cryobacterium melibiosiphilum]RJT85697.1 glutaminase A [Cryobacterium melibiosiphilum]
MESPIESYLRHLHAELSEQRDGTVYTPGGAPSLANPDAFGICLATTDGQVYEVGDTRTEFTLQSLSKVFTYAVALSDLGFDAVDAKVDVEPSGDPFNEISLAAGTGRPDNAMINAGALAVTSLIKGSGGKSAIKRIVRVLSDCAGRELAVSEPVFTAERRHSDRNHALAYLLSSFDIIEDDPTTVLENYLRHCSVQVTCRDLAIMAATLANGGTNPVTDVQALDLAPVERVLSVMMTSGMYDDAGAWLTAVGMPAKSGVGGGTLAVLPGQLGVAVFSPRIDAHGNSVRGSLASQRLSQELELHFVRAARSGRSTIRSSTDITELPSGIRHPDETAATLTEHGHRARVIELSGDLMFAGTEATLREVCALGDEVELVILDLRRVDKVGAVALRMLSTLKHSLAAAGRELLLIGTEGTAAETLADLGPHVRAFGTRSAAVEYAENVLIGRYSPELRVQTPIAAADSPALSALDREDAEAVAALMEPRACDDGEIVRRVGQRFGGVFFIVSGRISTIVPGPTNERVKLTTLSAGMTFGELALGSADRQETTEKADGPVQLQVLTSEAIAQLELDDPRLAVELWKALTRDAYTRVDQYLRETAVRIRD